MLHTKSHLECSMKTFKKKMGKQNLPFVKVQDAIIYACNKKKYLHLHDINLK